MNNLPSNSGHARGRGNFKPRENPDSRPVRQIGDLPQSTQSSGQMARPGPSRQQAPQQAAPMAASGVAPVDSQAGSELISDARGSVRGRRLISDVVHTRAKGLVSKMGTSGTRVAVQTNYFRILKRPDWTIYQYRVNFIPDVDSTRLRRAYVHEHCKELGGYIFDGTVLYCCKLFPQLPNSDYVLDLITRNRADEIIQIKIKHAATVESVDAQQFQVLNLVLRRAMEGLKLQLVSRNFFDPQAKINIENFRMELWPGYQTAIRQHESDILLSVEIAHKVMRTDNLYNILAETIRDNNDHQAAFKREVIGMVVLTDYNNKTYRVDEVDFSSSPSSTFSTRDGDVTYIAYYKKRYNITIRDHKQPLLVSHPTEKNIRGGSDQLIMLVPELSRATGMTDAMRADFRLMKAMSEHTRLFPDRRIDRLNKFNQRLQTSQQSVEVLKSWNLQLDRNLVELPARILPPERIVLGNGTKYLCDNKCDWTHEVKKSMFKSVEIKRWYVIAPKRNMSETQEFVKLCIRAASGMKMLIKEPRYDGINDDRNGTYSQAIDNAAAQDPQIIMVVIKMPNEEKYSCIKKRTCLDRPVPSQVVTLKTIAPRKERQGGLLSIATKVVIQMNAKLKGAPWSVDMPVSGLMTVGFDVCHSSKDKNKSYGALVATMDMKVSTNYFSTVTEHMKGQELSEQMAFNIALALKAYRTHHGALPERILFYRDGVGDGQLAQVVNGEVKKVKDKILSIYKSEAKEASCRLAFIIVSKRTNTRYFVNRRNPAPGTVIDDVITLPERYDFFLVSQSVNQGTVSPTNYNIVHDSMGLSADKLQILTQKMTHMYYNWSGTCRVPAVCQYAHKLAFLVAESIHRAPAAGLENQLYFL